MLSGALAIVALAMIVLPGIAGQSNSSTHTRAGPALRPGGVHPVFYKDVLPILQDHCQACHREGEIAPMPLVAYEQTRPWAAAIKLAVQSKQMPPWFADPRYGKFSNDPSLTAQQIALIAAWVDTGAPAGSPKDAPPPRHWAQGWNIPEPDKIVQMPQPVSLPATGDVEYTYEIVPTGFTEDKWVQMSEIRPSSPRSCASRGGLHPPAELNLVAQSAGRRVFYAVELFRCGRAGRSARDYQRHAAGLRAG